MIDVISRILCIIIAALPSVAVIALCISLYKDIHNLDAKLKQEDVNRIKKQAYKEFAEKLKKNVEYSLLSVLIG